MAKKTGRPKGAWRTRVDKALEAMPPGEITLDAVLRQVRKQKFKKGTHWESSVRRTLQEIRDEGGLIFNSRRRGGAHRPGTYFSTRPSPAQRDSWERMAAELGVDLGPVTGGAGVEPALYGRAWVEHVYTFHCACDDADEETDVAGAIREALRVLSGAYRTEVYIVAEFPLTDDQGRFLHTHYLQLASSMHGPNQAGSEAEVNYERFSNQGRYRIQTGPFKLVVRAKPGPTSP